MRFAWEKKKSGNDISVKNNFTRLLNLIMMAYNIIWWIPIILPFTGLIEYETGYIAFLVVTIVRLAANLVRNNVLKPEVAVIFPLRSP